MKKTLKLINGFMVMLVLMLITGLVAMPVHAEESTAEIKFEADDKPTDPLDPIDPEKPGEGPGTGSAGPLSLDYVPTLNFGTQTITGSVETYETTNTKPYVQVTDKRGTGEGWQLKASLSDFEDVATNTKKLNGAVITFNNSVVKTTATNTSSAPTGNDFTLTAGGSIRNVMTAQTDKGMGTWLQTWLASNVANPTNENVTLTVDTGNAYAESYLGTITWSIELAP